MTITNPEEKGFRQVVDKDLGEAVDQLPVRLQEVLSGLMRCQSKGGNTP